MSSGGSGFKCGDLSKCTMHPECVSETTTTQTIITGVAPVKMSSESVETSVGAENGCKCGSNCSCDPCNCK